MEYLTVGEIAKRSGLAVSTIHFWERKGLIRSSRSDGNQRRFARAELRRLAVIKIGQRAGISLAEIRDVLDTLPADRAVSVRSWTAFQNAGSRTSKSGSSAWRHCAISWGSVSAAVVSHSISAGCRTRTTSSPRKAPARAFSTLKNSVAAETTKYPEVLQRV